MFLHNYDKDGLTPVSEDEINSYATENYAAVKLLKVTFTDHQGLSLKDDADKEKIRELAQSYADRANSGEDWVDIQYDFDLRAAQYEAWTDAEDSYAEEHSSTAEAKSTEEAKQTAEAAETAEADKSTAEISETAESAAAETAEAEIPVEEIYTKPIVSTGDADYDKYVQDKIDAATAEKKESAEDCEQYIKKDSSPLNEKLTEYVWNTAADGKATLFENEEENCVYVVVRDDVTTMKSWLETQNEGILHGVKDDAFDELLKSTYDSYSVELNDYLVNTKYAPEKLRGIGK